MKKITINLNHALPFVDLQTWEAMADQTREVDVELIEGLGAGHDYIGWIDLPQEMDEEDLKPILEAAERIKKQSEVLVVIGIGGSYLGARAIIESLSHAFSNLLSTEQRGGPEIYFAGINLSGRYLKHLMEVIGDRDFSINVISKSGTTTEPAIAFRFLRAKLEEKYGKEEARNRIYVTTDESRGALKTLADQEGYSSFVIPDDVGGRFSVLTPVGLLPIAAAGIDIQQMIQGARDAAESSKNEFQENIIFQYAAMRHLLYEKGKLIEVLANYEPQLEFISEWWKQLYGESEGKDGKGIFPAAVNFTSDLHSMGQYLQDGKRFLFETVLNVQDCEDELIIAADPDNLDGLNYLAGKSMHEVNQKAMQGTLMAHVDGGVPNIIINIPNVDAYHIGYLIYFFERACAISGYLLKVNPFDQPGVEAYKKNMFSLLGK